MDIKVTDSRELHSDYEAQLRLYGYLLEQKGFDINDLLSSKSKCNTAGPDGLRCCHANERLYAHE